MDTGFNVARSYQPIRMFFVFFCCFSTYGTSFKQGSQVESALLLNSEVLQGQGHH